jgi:hypothetical protein
MGLYTGLSSAAVCALVDALSATTLRYYHGYKMTRISLEDQLLLTFIKLRLNVPILDLAIRFGISEKSASNVFKTFLFALHKLLFVACMSTVPSRTKCQSSVPACFKPFPNCQQI